MNKFRLKKSRPQLGNIIMVTIASLFILGSAAIILTGYICGNHYFTEEVVLEKIREKNPYAVGIEKPPKRRIFEPSLVTVAVKSGGSEDFFVYSNIWWEVTVE